MRSSALAIVAPVFPALTIPAHALPSLTASAARTRDESFLVRTPFAGSSSHPDDLARRDDRQIAHVAESPLIGTGRARRRYLRSATAWRAPATISAGALSHPHSRRGQRAGPAPRPSDVLDGLPAVVPTAVGADHIGQLRPPALGQMLRAGALSVQAEARRLRLFDFDVFFFGTPSCCHPVLSGPDRRRSLVSLSSSPGLSTARARPTWGRPGSRTEHVSLLRLTPHSGQRPWQVLPTQRRKRQVEDTGIVNYGFQIEPVSPRPGRRAHRAHRCRSRGFSMSSSTVSGFETPPADAFPRAPGFDRGRQRLRVTDSTHPSKVTSAPSGTHESEMAHVRDRRRHFERAGACPGSRRRAPKGTCHGLLWFRDDRPP